MHNAHDRLHDSDETVEALRRSEEHFRALVNQTIGGIAETDLNGRFTLVNDRYCEIVGYTREELLDGMNMQDLTHPEDLPRNLELFKRMMSAGRPFEIETRYLCKAGTEVWVHNSVSAVRDVSGKPQSATAVVVDITERKRAEEALRESETRLQLALAASGMGTFMWHVQEDRGEPDTRMLALFGLPADGTLSLAKALATLIHPDDRTGYAEAVARATDPADDGALHADIRVLHPDGSVRWLAINGQVFFEAEQEAGLRRAVRMSGMAADITERKRREANLAFLAEISQDLARLTNIDETMNRLGAKIGKYFNLSRCAFVEINEAEGEAVVTHDWHREDVPGIAGVYRLEDFATDEFRQASRAGETIVVRDTVADPRTDAEKLAALRVGSFVSVPLIRDGQWKFALAIYHSTPHDWRDNEIELIRELTTRIWTRLERARAEEALRESEQRLQMALVSGRMGAWDWDLITGQEVWTPEQERLFGHTPSQPLGEQYDIESFYRQVHPDDLPGIRERAEWAAAEGLDYVEDEFRIQLPDGTERWLFSRARFHRDAGGRAVRMTGVNMDVTERVQAEHELARLMAEMQQLNTTLEARVAERTEELSASQDQLRRLSLYVERAREDERARIAREVHDELGGALTGLKMTLGLVRQGRAADVRLMEVLRDATGQIDETVRAVRRIASDLRPPLLDDYGLLAALEWQANEFEKRTGVACRLSLPFQELSLTRERRTAVFRVFQESLTNVARHAGATRVVATVRQDGDHLVLKVRDNRRGISADVLQNGKSLGLLGMRERMREVAGDFEISGSPGRGTTVTVRVPLT